MNDITSYITQYQNKEESYKPTFFRLSNPEDKTKLEEVFEQNHVSFVRNEIYGQLQELIKSNNPSRKIKPEEYPQLINSHLNGEDLNEFGVWVYYPWSKTLVHLLDEEDFVAIRTNRNQYKITKQEQAALRQKKVGIVGLSVGQSIALTMAMERIFGEIRLADFDTAELSNLNRIRTGVVNLGLNKTVIVAREIAEIDPFLKVTIYSEGLTEENMDQFFTAGGKIDLLVEVCDGLDIKILSRYKARELQIPVIMDTNDKGMLDVERFDLEPMRPILHGLADGLDPKNISNISNEDKIPYILKMIGAESISTRLKASMLEVEQSINTWPQLASSVTLGGALTTDVSRRILLDQYHDSGRYYIDLEELVKDKHQDDTSIVPPAYIGPAKLVNSELLQAIEGIAPSGRSVEIPENLIKEIVQAGILAPSGGNTQPWKFVYNDTGLFIFHDVHFSYSLLDFNNLGSYISIGAVIENIRIKASALGFGIDYNYFPVQNNKNLVAHVIFNNTSSPFDKNREKGLDIRVTNRDLTVKESLPALFYENLSASIGSIPGAALHIVDDEALMEKLSALLAQAEMLRMLHPRGHFDTFTNEIRWTSEEVNRTRDGLDVLSLGASNSELAGFKVAADRDAIGLVRRVNGGNGFQKLVLKAVAHSSALGIVTMPAYSEVNFLEAGQAVERIWIESNLAGVSMQPISQLVFMLAMLENDPGQMDDDYKQNLSMLKEKLYQLLPQLQSRQLTFIFRLSKGGLPKVRSLRRPLEESFIYQAKP